MRVFKGELRSGGNSRVGKGHFQSREIDSDVEYSGDCAYFYELR